MIIIYTLLRANYVICSVNVLFLHFYIKIIIIEQLCTKKELYKLKSLKEEKKQMVHSNDKRKRSDFDGSRREHVVCRFYLPHGSPQRAKHNARERGNIGRGSAKGEESKRYSNRNWNEKGNCVIYSAEQGASVSSVCTHRWIGWCKREGWRQRFVSWREVSLRKLRWNNGIECNPDRWVMI